MSHLRICIVAALSVLSCACDKFEPRTQVMLIVDADDAVEKRALLLRVKIEGMAAGQEGSSETDTYEFKPMRSESTSWPYHFALIPKGGDATRTFRAEAMILDSAAELAVLRTTSGFVKGKTLALELRFDASCLGQHSLGCAESETCVDGACIPAGLDPRGLPEHGGKAGSGMEIPAAGRGTITSGVAEAGSGGRAAAGSGGAAAGSGGSRPATAGSAGMPVIHTGSGNCGDGKVSEDEACDTAITAPEPGACPTACTPSQPCESTALEGSGCLARCVTTPITALVPDDGCCPPGADANGDSDCGASCGNGVIESGESCDPIASCPSPASCQPSDACLNAVVSGDPATCNATCRMDPISACQSGDGCCPASCTSGTDGDCSPSCGNGVIDAQETCESQSSERPCPTSCADGDACTLDLMTGSPNNCNVRCVRLPILTPLPGDGCCPLGANANNDSDCAPSCGNGVTERGERCDGNCPTAGSCDDANSCTVDTLSGADCTLQCARTRITAPSAQSDGCCPPTANANNDPDCPPSCGNGVVERGELCDGNCPTSCADNDPCTDDTLSGTACMARCPHTPVQCGPPMTCGNGVREGNEACDGNDCPSCDTNPCSSCGTSCTVETITTPRAGDSCCPSGATAATDSDCAGCGNDRVEADELCDGNCPASCADSDPCTNDELVGTACMQQCRHAPIGRSGPVRDQCCPAGDDEYQDADCRPRCGNDQVETGEECDGTPMCVNCQMVGNQPDAGPPPPTP